MTAVPQTNQPSAFMAFRNRSFRLMWTAQLVSTAGSALTSLAAGILVYRITNSVASVGLMLMASALPSLLIGLIAGVFVDRIDRKKIMIIADVIRAVISFSIPFLVPHSIAWLYILILLASGVGQFFDPAHESVLPEIATDAELASANSLIGISSFGATAIGFAASGLIASRFPIEWAFFLDAASFLFSAACISLIKIPHIKPEGETNVAAVVSNLKAGVQYLFNNKILRSTLLIGIPIFVSFGLWNSLLLPFALKALHATEFEYGLQEGLTSVGFVLGSLMMAQFITRLREGQWVAISYVTMGVVSILYGLSRTVPIAILLVMVSGFLNAPSSIARRLIIQRNTQREVRGRVNSAFFVTRDAITLIGMGAAGLADLLGVRIMVMVSAVMIITGGGLALVIPGLGLPAAEWKRSISLLKGARFAPGMGPARPATLADFDLLAAQLPAISSLDLNDRQSLAMHSLVTTAEAGSTIIHQGDQSTAAYFLLDGRVVAGKNQDGKYAVLEVLNAGDFFGEIAALTGAKRTADVVAEAPTTVLQVPAATLRQMMSNPQLNRIFINKMTERMVRMNMVDLPRLSSLDQQSLRELRSASPVLVVDGAEREGQESKSGSPA